VRGVSCCLHAIDGLGGDLVLLQRGLPESGAENGVCGACPAGTFKDEVDNTSEPGAGCALAHGCCTCGANETTLAEASVHSDACVCLPGYAGRGCAPCGVGFYKAETSDAACQACAAGATTVCDKSVSLADRVRGIQGKDTAIQVQAWCPGGQAGRKTGGAARSCRI
jgi:hypothetical protein